MTKFASHHLLLYVVYMCQKSLNFIYAFKCYQQNVSGFTLAGPPCRIGKVRTGTSRPTFNPLCYANTESQNSKRLLFSDALFHLCSPLNKGELVQSFYDRMPFLSSTSSDLSLDLILSLTTKTHERGKGRYSLYVGSPKPVPQERHERKKGKELKGLLRFEPSK